LRGLQVAGVGVSAAVLVFAIRGALLDRECRVAWYRVQLPLRPNGITGYVRAGSVWVGRVRTRIVVDLSERRVSLFRRGRLLMRGKAAIEAEIKDVDKTLKLDAKERSTQLAAVDRRLKDVAAGKARAGKMLEAIRAVR
jgi:hypothetical protein